MVADKVTATRNKFLLELNGEKTEHLYIMSPHHLATYGRQVIVLGDIMVVQNHEVRSLDVMLFKTLLSSLIPTAITATLNPDSGCFIGPHYWYQMDTVATLDYIYYRSTPTGGNLFLASPQSTSNLVLLNLGVELGPLSSRILLSSSPR